MLPLSLRRRGRRALCVELVILVVAGVTAALVPVGPAAARPRRADLAITNMVAGPAEVLMGEIIGIGVTVSNVGTRVTDTVTVYVTLPPTLQPPSPGGLGIPWTCDALAPGWRCVHGALTPGEVADELQVHGKVVAGAPGMGSANRASIPPAPASGLSPRTAMRSSMPPWTGRDTSRWR
jgi:hypothetical protein